MRREGAFFTNGSLVNFGRSGRANIKNHMKMGCRNQILEIWTLHATWRHACWIVYVPRVDSHQGPCMPGVHAAHRAAHPYQSKREPGYRTLSKQSEHLRHGPAAWSAGQGVHPSPTRGSTEAPWSAGQGVHPSPTLSFLELESALAWQGDSCILALP